MKRAVSILFCAIAFFLTGCSSDSNTSAGAEDPAQLRIVNLVPDSPALRVLIENGLHATLSYTQSSAMSPAVAQGYRFEVNYFPVDGITPINVVPRQRIRLRHGTETNVLIAGSLDAADFLLIQDDYNAEIATGSAQLRLANTISATGSLDLYLSEDATVTGITGISPVTVAQGEYSDPLTIASGDVRLFVTQAGSSTILYDSGPFTLPDTSRSIVALVDYFGPGGTFRGIRIGAQGSSALPNEALPSTIRVAQMITDLAQVDLAVDGTVVQSGIPYDSVSMPVEITAGSHSFALTRSGQPLSVLFQATRNVSPGEERTLVVAGFAATADVGANFALDSRRPIGSAAQLRVINAGANTGKVDVYLLETDEEIANAAPTNATLAFLASSTALVAAGEYDLVVTEAGDDTVQIGPVHVTLEDGGVYTVIVRDAAGGGTPGAILLEDDFAG